MIEIKLKTDYSEAKKKTDFVLKTWTINRLKFFVPTLLVGTLGFLLFMTRYYDGSASSLIVLGIFTFGFGLHLHALVFLTIKTYKETRKQLSEIFSEKTYMESVFIFSDNDLEVKIIDNKDNSNRIVTPYKMFKEIKYYEKDKILLFRRSLKTDMTVLLMNNIERDLIIEVINMIAKKISIKKYNQIIDYIEQ